MSKYNWKVWLRLNKLTPNPTDYVAEVDTAGDTRRQQDIIDRITAEGSEVKPETIKAVLDRANAVKRDFLLAGYGVFDDFIHLTPRIDGAWSGRESFTEGKHRVTVDAILSKAMHEEFKQVGVEVLGVAESGARIMLVTDVATQLTDGTVTPGDDIVIAGDKIKLAGLPQPDGVMEPGIGVFFVLISSGDSMEAIRVSENLPARLVARVPTALAPGESLMLHIVTRYSNGATLLREPRTIIYNLPLKVPDE
jgi:hypothetical protein